MSHLSAAGRRIDAPLRPAVDTPGFAIDAATKAICDVLTGYAPIAGYLA